MQELLRLQAEYAKQSNTLQKQDRLLQIAQVYGENQIKKDEDINVKSLQGLEKSLKQSVEVQKGLRKDVQDLSKTLKQDTSEKDIQKSEKGKSNSEELVTSLKSLEKVIQENIGKFVKSGGGEALGNKIANEAGSNDAVTQPNNKLTMRKILFGNQTKEEINKDSFFGVSKKLNRAVEKREFRAAAKESDRGTIATGNLPDKRSYWKKMTEGSLQNKRADRLFEEKKAEEDRLSNVQMKLNRAKEAGLSPLKKDVAERDDAAKAVIEKTPALKEQFVPEVTKPKKVKVEKATKVEKIAANEATFEVAPVVEAPKKRGRKAKVEKADVVNPEHTTSNVIPFPSQPKAEKVAHTEQSEDATEAQTLKAADDKAMISSQHEMGATLIQSLEVQKQMLESFKKMADTPKEEGSGSSGGSMLETAADLAGNGKGGKGKMLGKAAGFLGKHAGKIGAIGGVAMGAYDAYSGWNDAEDAQKRGEITKEEANVKKGGAVGKGVGGAGGAWAGAAAGAALGSVVPVVGTAIGGLIGGALGYWGGSKAGEAIGEGATSLVQGSGGDSAKIEEASKKNAEAKVISTGTIGNTVVNAPTNNVINNSNSNTPSRSPIRNQESSVSKYIENRYA